LTIVEVVEPPYKIRKRRIARDFAIIGVSIIIAIYIQTSFIADVLVSSFANFYFIPAAFLMGFLFSLTFTAAISTSVFLLLAETAHNPFLIALFGGLGSVGANSIVYKFLKKRLLMTLSTWKQDMPRKLPIKLFTRNW